MNEARRGKRISQDNPMKTHKVEVGVEIGLIVNVECTEKDIEQEVKEKVTDLFHLDGQDKVLNNVCIYNVQ